MLILQLVLYCLIFTLMVKYAVRGGPSTDCIFTRKRCRNEPSPVG